METQEKPQSSDILEQALLLNDTTKDDEELADMVALLDAQTSIDEVCDQVGPLPVQNSNAKVKMSSIVQPSELKLKSLPKDLRYAFLRNSNTLPFIIFASLTSLEEDNC